MPLLQAGCWALEAPAPTQDSPFFLSVETFENEQCSGRWRLHHHLIVDTATYQSQRPSQLGPYTGQSPRPRDKEGLGDSAEF